MSNSKIIGDKWLISKRTRKRNQSQLNNTPLGCVPMCFENYRIIGLPKKCFSVLQNKIKTLLISWAEKHERPRQITVYPINYKSMQGVRMVLVTEYKDEQK